MPEQNGAAESEDFDALLRDVTENPEKLLSDDISDEQILALQRKMNPYSYTIPEDGEQVRSAAISCTNLRAEYLERFTMTSLVGFIFRMFGEWEVPIEERRWVSKAAARRARKTASEDESTSPFTPDELVARAEALLELAKLAKGAADESNEMTEKAKLANADLAGMEAAEESAAAIKQKRAEVDGMMKTADASLAKSRGLQYASMYEMRKSGFESNKRIDSMTAIARQHPEVREVIDRSPIERTPPGQQEVPPGIAKNIIGGFLRNWFEYNPDAHVREAYDEFKIAADVGDVELPGVGTVKTDTKDPERLPLAVVRAQRIDFASQDDAEAYAAMTASQETYNATVFVLRNQTLLKAVVAAGSSNEMVERFRRYLFPISPSSAVRPAVDIIPPQDTFHRWNYYTEVNMEALRTATDAIYHEKPDLDWALAIYELFAGTREEVDAEFETFRDKHQDELISDIKGVDLGGWTLLGDFAENRDKIQFLNKHTEVLKRILDRHADDKKLGADLMRNRVRQAKAKNIREAGPDAPGLSEYKGSVADSGPGTMGAERVISREEMFRLERARGNIKAAKELEFIDTCRETIKELSASAKVRELSADEERRLKTAQEDIVKAQEMIEVPDDGIQVDVFTHNAKAGTFGKSKFYTKSEAPLKPEDIERAQANMAAKARPPSDRPSNLAESAVGNAREIAPFAQEHLAAQIESERTETAKRVEAAKDANEAAKDANEAAKDTNEA